MKTLLALLCLSAAALAAPVKDHLGLQLWSLRHDLEADVDRGLAEARGLGIRIVEPYSLHGLTASAFHAKLAAAGLVTPSLHVSYERLLRDLPAVVADAKTLGARYVVLAWLPFDRFDADLVDRVAPEFNAWGAALRREGLRFAYHPHGYEFHPLPDSSGRTAFDLLMARTHPGDVFYEMDVFWVKHGGADPLALLEAYPGRWTLLHVKDLRAGATEGAGTRQAPPSDNVAVGQGQFDWPRLFAAADKEGVEYYFIEDETDAPLPNIRESLRYLARFER